MMQKGLAAGTLVLVLGVVSGYVAGVSRERSVAGQNRTGNAAGYGVAADRDAGQGRGVAMRDGSGAGIDRGQGSGGGRQGREGMGNGSGNGRNVDKGTCLSDECLLVDGLDYPAGELSAEAKSALLSAIDDEYKALATYEAVMAKEGRVRPFVMIAGAEEQHIASLEALLDKYGIAVPKNPWMNTVSVPSTMTASCQAGVDAEVANASLYRDTLLPAVKEYPDITGVFTNLMDASQTRHLPAFDRCN